MVKALLSSGGFTTEEQAEALEFVAKNAGDPDLEVPGEDQHSIQAKSPGVKVFTDVSADGHRYRST